MIEFPKLPFALNALEPYISARTFEFHHGKHHRAYVEATNKLVVGTDLENASLEKIIKAADERRLTKLYNNSAQVWNHTFFWHSLRQPGGAAPGGALAAHIESQFGGLDGLRTVFKDAAVGHFGSGWVWLVARKQGLEVLTLHDSDTPVVHDIVPLLTCDLWEHSYYLDYQNARASYIDAFFDHLANWDFAAINYDGLSEPTRRSTIGPKV